MAIEYVVESNYRWSCSADSSLQWYKISNPTVWARIEDAELEPFFRGCGWALHFVEGDDPAGMHQPIATTLEEVIADIHEIHSNARSNNDNMRRRWPSLER